MGNMRGLRVQRFGRRERLRGWDLGIFGGMDVQVGSMFAFSLVRLCRGMKADYCWFGTDLPDESLNGWIG